MVSLRKLSSVFIVKKIIYYSEGNAGENLFWFLNRWIIATNTIFNIAYKSYKV